MCQPRPVTASDSQRTEPPSVLIALLFDVLAVLIFALAGRVSHDEAITVGGMVSTAGPFLVGLLVGWFLGLFKLREARSLQFAILIWGATLFVGMGVRAFTGGGTPASFVVVAAVVLAVLLVGWRLIEATSRRKNR